MIKIKARRQIKIDLNIDEHKNDLDASPLINPFLFLRQIDIYKNDQQKLKQESAKIFAALKQFELGLSSDDFNYYLIYNLKNMLEQYIGGFEILALRNVVEEMISKCVAKMNKIESNKKT